jgi:hypothetical protein
MAAIDEILAGYTYWGLGYTDRALTPAGGSPCAPESTR